MSKLPPTQTARTLLICVQINSSQHRDKASGPAITELVTLLCYDSVMSASTRPSEVFPGRLRAAREKRSLKPGRSCQSRRPSGIRNLPLRDWNAQAVLRQPAAPRGRPGRDHRLPTGSRDRRLRSLREQTSCTVDLDRLTANDRDIAEGLSGNARRQGERPRKQGAPMRGDPYLSASLVAERVVREQGPYRPLYLWIPLHARHGS